MPIILKNYSMSNPDLEAFAAMFTKPNHNTIVLLNLYRPPSGNFGHALNFITSCLLELVCEHRRAE